MNQRQAKIEALRAAIGILQGSDMGTFLDLQDDKDVLRAWQEFEAIRDGLLKRVERLEGNRKNERQ